MKKFFGTDGIRGIANQGLITAPIALKLGSAAATLFTKGEHRHLVVIGKDTRLSGYLLEPALTSGFIASGMDVLLIGPMPTPAISILTKSLRADIGIMISASHNTYQYNGIKIFNSKGEKLDKETEDKIEELILSYPSNIMFASPEKLGRATRLDDAPGRYIEFAKNTFPKNLTLHGIKIVIDSANGAAYHIAKKIFWELGAEVIQIGNSPNGLNINENCGSTNPDLLISKVLEYKADLGIALDGDADRVVLVDEKGKVVDGDKIIAAIAVYMKSKSLLKSKYVIGTHLSNKSLEDFLSDQDLTLIRADIGDKNVYQKMVEYGSNLGGEQSGHIILSDFSATGDGIVAALQVLAYFVESDYNSISSLCDKFIVTPQTVKNIRYNTTNFDIMYDKTIMDSIQNFESKLGPNSRLLVRKSGTEPVIRIMIESTNLVLAESIAKELEHQILNLS